YMSQRDFPHAIGDYTSAIALSTRAHPYAYIRSVYASRGYAYLQLDEYPQAIDDLNMVIDRLASASPVGMKPLEEQRRRLAEAYMRVGDVARATIQYDVLISGGYAVWSDYLDVGRAQLEAGDADRAVATLSTALEKLADAPDAPDRPVKRARIQVALAQA